MGQKSAGQQLIFFFLHHWQFSGILKSIFLYPVQLQVLRSFRRRPHMMRGRHDWQQRFFFSQPIFFSIWTGPSPSDALQDCVGGGKRISQVSVSLKMCRGSLFHVKRNQQGFNTGRSVRLYHAVHHGVVQRTEGQKTTNNTNKLHVMITDLPFWHPGQNLHAG